MKNFLKALIVVPFAVAIVLFAIANRQIITVHLDPFETVTLPLFLVLFITGLIGVVAGGVAAWLAQGKHRRAAKQHKRESQSHRAELDRIKAQAQAKPSLMPALPPPASI